MTGPYRDWIIIVRLCGVITGLVFLPVAAAPHSSGPTTSYQTIVNIDIFIIGILLLIPWRLVTNELVWIVLVVVLAASVLFYTIPMIGFSTWSLYSFMTGAEGIKDHPVLVTSFALLGLLLSGVLLLQFPAIIMMRRGHSNKTLHHTDGPTGSTSGEG